jgi:hypothetical protein
MYVDSMYVTIQAGDCRRYCIGQTHRKVALQSSHTAASHTVCLVPRSEGGRKGTCQCSVPPGHIGVICGGGQGVANAPEYFCNVGRIYLVAELNHCK